LAKQTLNSSKFEGTKISKLDQDHKEITKLPDNSSNRRIWNSSKTYIERSRFAELKGWQF